MLQDSNLRHFRDWDFQTPFNGAKLCLNCEFVSDEIRTGVESKYILQRLNHSAKHAVVLKASTFLKPETFVYLALRVISQPLLL